MTLANAPLQNPPPAVPQLGGTLPDGLVDPDRDRISGWACAASAVAVWRDLSLSAGCLRQAMRRDSKSLEPSAHDLHSVARAMGLYGQPFESPASSWSVVKGIADRTVGVGPPYAYMAWFGRYNDDERDQDHWVLQYGQYSSPSGVVVMDPWYGHERNIDSSVLQAHWLGQACLFSFDQRFF